MNPKPVSSNFRITAKARNDLLQIGRHTDLKWGRKQRDHYLKQLDEAFNLIGENPKIGIDCSHVLAGYRSFQQGAHVIFYRESEMIEIIRILHKRMEVEKHIQ